MEGSSNSSLSSTVESPSISSEAIAEVPNVAHHSKTSSISGTSAMSREIEEELGDDEEIDTDWSSRISPEILEKMSDAEKKRQEIINGLYSELMFSNYYKFPDFYFCFSLQKFILQNEITFVH